MTSRRLDERHVVDVDLVDSHRLQRLDEDRFDGRGVCPDEVGVGDAVSNRQHVDRCEVGGCGSIGTGDEDGVRLGGTVEVKGWSVEEEREPSQGSTTR